MAVKNAFNRQKVLAIVADLGIGNIGAGNEVTAKLPQGALVVDVQSHTVTAFDGTTNTATITDGTTAFVSAVDVKSTGIETAAVAGKFYPQGGTITFSLAQTGTATVGRNIGVVQYVQLGVGDAVYG